MSPEELAALGISAETPSVNRSIEFSGFADFGFGVSFVPRDSIWRGIGAAPTKSTFYVGNFNLYLSKQISESVRTLGEVRLSFLPNGSTSFGLNTAEDTTVSDYVDFGRPNRWGGIILQRIYVEYAPHPLFSIRGGQFLTPYGVWNVDHGSPVVIPVRRPWSIGIGWIPERQVGVEILGRTTVSDMHAVGYHLTLSNGTGPVSEYRDLDENKAVGGRVFWEYRALGRLRIGASVYYGRETGAALSPVLEEGRYKSKEVIETQFDALSFAGDLTWSIGGLHVQTEWLTNQRAYTKAGRVQRPSSGTLLIPSDTVSWGGYALVGYRFDWLGVMPFFLTERVKGELQLAIIKLYTLQWGLNVRPIDSLVMKASFEYVNQGELVGPLRVLMTQVAWAF